MKQNTYPNRLQALLAKRRHRRVFFGLFWVMAICVSLVFTDHTYAATLYQNTSGGSDQVPPQMGAGSDNTNGFPLGTGLSGTVDTMFFTTKRVGTSAKTVGVQILCYSDGTYASADSGCSYNYISGGAYADAAGSCDAIGTGANGGAYAERSCTPSTPFVFDPSKYYSFRILGNGFAGTTAYIEVNSGGSLPVYRLEGDVAPILLTNNSTGSLPGSTVNFTVSWAGLFSYPDQPRYLYFFPYGKEGELDVCGDISNPCPSPVVKLSDPSTQLYRFSLSGSGTYSFDWVYPSSGDFTATVLMSSDCVWNNGDTDLGELSTDIANECNYSLGSDSVPIGGFELLSPTFVNNVISSWTNGGSQTATGSYFATDKTTYEIGESVYLKWRYNAGALTVSSIKIYSGSGNELVATVTGSGNLSNDIYHYARIFYSQPGQYLPKLRVCVGDCSTVYFDIFPGGGSTADYDHLLTILDTTFQSSPYAGPSNYCSTRGVFGYDPAYFNVAFADDANVFFKGVEPLINKGIQSLMWIGSNIMCAFENAPLIDNISQLLAPPPGTYDLPTELFGVAIDPEEVFGADSYVVAYNTDTETAKLGTVLSGGFFAYLLMMFILKGIFGNRRSHS